jgi:hypothetical protein
VQGRELLKVAVDAVARVLRRVRVLRDDVTGLLRLAGRAGGLATADLAAHLLVGRSAVLRALQARRDGGVRRGRVAAELVAEELPDRGFLPGDRRVRLVELLVVALRPVRERGALRRRDAERPVDR